jgi:hypothetical protein
MQNSITIEMIPVSKYPIQGTIIADLINITPSEMQISIPSLLDEFILVGDTVPVIVRAHDVHIEESECEFLVLDKSTKSSGVSCLYGIFSNNTSPNPEIILTADAIKKHDLIIENYDD